MEDKEVYERISSLEQHASSIDKNIGNISSKLDESIKEQVETNTFLRLHVADYTNTKEAVEQLEDKYNKVKWVGFGSIGILALLGKLPEKLNELIIKLFT